MKDWNLKRKVFVGTAAFFVALILFGVAHHLSADNSSVVSPPQYEDFEPEVQQEESSEETEVLGLSSETPTLTEDTDFSSSSAQAQALTVTALAGEPQPSTQGETVDSGANDSDDGAPEPDPNDGSSDSSATENQTSAQQTANDSSDSDGDSTESEPTATPSATPTPVPAPTLGVHRLGEYSEPIILKVGESFGVLEVEGTQIYLRGDGDVLRRSSGPDSSVIFAGVRDGSVEIIQQKVEKELSITTSGYVIRTVLVGKTCYVQDGQIVWCDGLVQAE